jgi:hypothetical protein
MRVQPLPIQVILNNCQIERTDLTMIQTNASDPIAVVERTFEAAQGNAGMFIAVDKSGC